MASRARGAVLVDLFEMRPGRMTPAHGTGLLAELVCSNSLKTESRDAPAGLLKMEMERLGSIVIRLAKENRVPAGAALAVDRMRLAAAVTEEIESLPGVRVVREEVESIPEGYDAVIVATGPLTSDSLSDDIEKTIGAGGLYFYDAIAPIVEADSVDWSIAFIQDRYGPAGEGGYANLPMSRREYEGFIDELLSARAVEPREFEKGLYFEGCLPIEETARRGREALAFGPLKPVGLLDPRTGRRPHAVVQLRKENAAGDAYNMVGFQTKLAYPEQERVFRRIPGLSNAVFLRHGSLHRNTYINSPKALNRDLSLKAAPGVRMAGQLTGVEGYSESAATGMLAGIFTAGQLMGAPVDPPPPETCMGALLGYITDPSRAESFQPSNINFSLFPPLDENIRNRKERRRAVLERASEAMDGWKKSFERLFPPAA